ncbi:winged helix-turn-helix transcriptional regulator [Candidatus Nitrosocosmicus hydrocola]|uniref:winged helix-turn-helix transcriptional regulator n=1 Tax=Candidatus Nitrosocosmicus hydrocola TaxID=1826872 RepID=UPI001372B8F0|nr:winged helix-turn-helix transcriptional regulator [Candidatus Nitrosocosmicus hydrocola]
MNEKRLNLNHNSSNDNNEKYLVKKVQKVVEKNQTLKAVKSNKMILDSTNLGIIEALINNGDIKSSEIAAKLKIPLSTIQRRKSNLEKSSILKKNYTVDLKKMGLRVAEISVATKRGLSQNVLDNFYIKHKQNIIDMALRIGNPDTNVSFRVAYRDSIELFSLLEEIKEMEMVSMVQWSEYITEKRNEKASFSELL